MTTIAKPRSLKELLSAWQDVICGDRGRTAEGAAELRRLEDEAYPHDIGNAIVQVGATIVTDNSTVLVTVVLRDKARDNTDTRDVHPLVAAAADFVGTIKTLARALKENDRRGDWDNAILIGGSLVEVTDTKEIGTWDTDAAGPISLGRLHKVAPELAKNLHDRLPGRDERIRQQLTNWAASKKDAE